MTVGAPFGAPDPVDPSRRQPLGLRAMGNGVDEWRHDEHGGVAWVGARRVQVERATRSVARTLP